MKCSLDISNFLKRSLVFPIVLFTSVSLHWWLRKAFLSLLAVLWNSAFRCLYLCFSPSLLASLLFTAICKASSDNHFAFLHFLFLGWSWSLPLVQCLEPLSGTLCLISNPLNLFVTSTAQSEGIRFRSYLSGLEIFPTSFNLSLNLAVHLPMKYKQRY